MKNIEEFNREIVNFCRLYNFPVHGNEDIKNKLFCRFYAAIAEAAEVPSRFIESLETIIFYLCTTLHDWDNLVEKEGIKEDTYRFFLDRITSKNTSIKEAIQKISYPEELFVQICRYSMEKIKDYFLLEEKAMKLITSEEMILSLLKKGNCDFEFYNDIFFKLMKEEYRDSLTSFFNKYFIADLIADHITDLKDDMDTCAYNPLILLYRLRNDENSAYMETCKHFRGDCYSTLCEDNIMDWFISLAEKEIEEGEKSLKNINPGKLKNLLTLYLEGISEGFSLLKKYEYLSWMEKDKRYFYITLLLKPHPWERFYMGIMKPEV